MSVHPIHPKKRLIISDFDGTACAIDLGNSIFQRFAADGWQEIDNSYSANEIGSRLAYGRVAAMIKASKEEMLSFIQVHGRLDPYFRDFYLLCQKEGLDIKIVSDGLDFYIEAVFKLYELQDIEYYANYACFSSDTKLSIRFPELNSDCRRCGTCKTSIVKNYRSQYDQIIYIGDSYSDVCAAKEADLVFAKNILYEKCQLNGTPCLAYENFGDIVSYFRHNGLIP